MSGRNQHGQRRQKCQLQDDGQTGELRHDQHTASEVIDADLQQAVDLGHVAGEREHQHDIAGLDSQTGRTIMTLIRALVRSEGVTAIVATHDPVLIDLADRAIELSDGRIISDSTAAPLAS